MDPNTKPSAQTRDAERADAARHPQADNLPTPEEELAAERAGGLDPDVAEHYEEMTQRGASQRGEGRIP